MKNSTIIDNLTHIGPYVMVKKIGKGLTGVVYEAVHYKNSGKVAVKIINKKCLKNESLLRVEREVVLMKLIRHPHIVELLDIYEDKNFLFIILEHASGGELFDYIVKRKILPIDEAKKFFCQMLSAVEFCHKHYICHRDLKPENLLLDSNNSLKVGDFGMASIQDKGHFMDTSCGSPHYASPEVISGHKYDGIKSDVWSMGVILYALLTGGLPFNDKSGNIPLVLEKIRKGVFKIPPRVPDECQVLLKGMINTNVSERMTIDDIKKNSWVQGGCKDCKENNDYVDKEINFMNESDIDLSLVKHIALILGSNEKSIISEKLMVPGFKMEKSLYNLLLSWYKNYSGNLKSLNKGESSENVNDEKYKHKNTLDRSQVVNIHHKNDSNFYSLGSPFDEPELLKLYNHKSKTKANPLTNCLNMFTAFGRKIGLSSEENKLKLSNDDICHQDNSYSLSTLNKSSLDNSDSVLSSSEWIKRFLTFECSSDYTPVVYLVKNSTLDDLRRILIRSLVIACKSHSFNYTENNTNHFLVELNSSKLMKKCVFSIRISQIDNFDNNNKNSEWLSYDNPIFEENLKINILIAVVFKHKFGSYDCFKKCVQHIDFIIKSTTEKNSNCLDDNHIAHNFEQLNLSECEDHINDLYIPKSRSVIKKSVKLSPVTCSPSNSLK